MSGRLRPAAHGTNMEFREVSRHQDVVHGYIQQGAQGVEIVHRGQTLAPLPLVDGLGPFKTEELVPFSEGVLMVSCYSRDCMGRHPLL